MKATGSGPVALVTFAVPGRYLVLDGSGSPVELATFEGKPDVSCYSRTQARDLHREIQRSDTVSGRVAPRFSTTTICAFVDATTARCWQYSPAERMYVDVGGWSPWCRCNQFGRLH